jgi:cyclopropane-fatty-acyl-phospholipid synthase
MVIKDLEIFDMIISKSDIGLGEGYIKTLWDTESVSNLIEFAVLNRNALKAAMYGQWHRLLRYKVKHMISRNSKRGSQKNISAHYDLGNSFYKLWLDETMTYSSAYWGTDTELSLASAQHKKYKLLLDNLKAKPGAHILEIGCGWGGFAECAARNGMRVTAITISEEQRVFAVERMKRLGLDAQVEILFMDYRELKGQFDHVVSIEMLEAVGIEYWQQYFTKINEILKPGGTVSIQSITIHDSQFEQYRKGTDFIQQYIFPGGLLPCEKEISKIVKQTLGCKPEFLHFGLDYARTLALWAEKFQNEKTNVSALGYSEEFQKMWEFYLGYCEGAFRAGQINVVMISFRSVNSSTV